MSVDTGKRPAEHDDPGAPATGLSRRAKVGIVVVLGTLVAMWVAVVAIRLTDENPDRLDDEVTTAQANEVCAGARAGIPVRPPGRGAETPAVRADRLDAETAALAAMVDELSALQWSTPHDRDLVDRWLADWRQHLADRTVFAEQVRGTDSNEVVFNGAAPEDESITFRMDAFSDTNGLDECFVPADPEITAT